MVTAIEWAQRCPRCRSWNVRVAAADPRMAHAAAVFDERPPSIESLFGTEPLASQCLRCDHEWLHDTDVTSNHDLRASLLGLRHVPADASEARLRAGVLAPAVQERADALRKHVQLVACIRGNLFPDAAAARTWARYNEFRADKPMAFDDAFGFEQRSLVPGPVRWLDIEQDVRVRLNAAVL